MKPLLLAVALTLPFTAHAQALIHAPDGGTRERIQSISILPTPGAPFSATVTTEWTRLLEDGTTTTVKNHRTVARDSSGRIFEERRFFSPTGDKDITRLSELDFSDPTRKEIFLCSPERQLCTVSGYYAPATVPTAPQHTPPGANVTVTVEALGEKRIEDLEVQGSREIITVKQGVNGYKQDEPTIKEFWYSPRLEINVLTRRFEPRGGAQTFTVSNVNLSEPDPKLFQPPATFRIVHTESQASARPAPSAR